MTLALWSLLPAFLLPYLFVGYAKFSGGRFRPQDNHDPRAFLAQVEGAQKRALNAQLNSFEVNPAFAAAVLVAEFAQGDQFWTNTLALSFLASRVIYGVCYIKDWASVRSLVWSIGMLCIVGLFFVAGAN